MQIHKHSSASLRHHAPGYQCVLGVHGSRHDGEVIGEHAEEAIPIWVRSSHLAPYLACQNRSTRRSEPLLGSTTYLPGGEMPARARCLPAELQSPLRGIPSCDPCRATDRQSLRHKWLLSAADRDGEPGARPITNLLFHKNNVRHQTNIFEVAGPSDNDQLARELRRFTCRIQLVLIGRLPAVVPQQTKAFWQIGPKMRTDSKHDLENDEARGDVFIFDPTYDPFVADLAEITRKNEIVGAKAIQRAKVLAREFEAKGMELGHSLATLDDMHGTDGLSVECFAETTLGLAPAMATHWLGKYRTIEQSGVGKKRLSKVCAANLSILAVLVPDECFPACIEEAEWMAPDVFSDFALHWRQSVRLRRRVQASTRALAAAAAKFRVGATRVTPVASQNPPFPSWLTGKTRSG